MLMWQPGFPFILRISCIFFCSYLDSRLCEIQFGQAGCGQHSSTNKGFSDIIQEMEQNGVSGRLGRPIKYPKIYEMLRNERYTGTYIYLQDKPENREARRTKKGAIRIDNAIPKIIDKQTWLEVQKILSSRKHTGRKREYLCNGLVY